MAGHDGHRERMRQRFLREGLMHFEDHNILELLLFYALPRRDTNLLAHQLMETFGSLDAVFDAPPEALTQINGIGENAAVLIHLVPEIARRYGMAKEGAATVLRDADAAGRFLLPRFSGVRTEQVYLVCLDARFKVLDCRCMASGGASSAVFDLRRIVEVALNRNAAGVILAHNHTNGIALPSKEDEDVTLRLRDALSAVSVKLVDHIVVAEDDYVSMSDNGLLK